MIIHIVKRNDLILAVFKDIKVAEKKCDEFRNDYLAKGGTPLGDNFYIDSHVVRER